MFTNNKYTTWYFCIIELAKNSCITGYTEKHHIIPKCMGGSNDKSNIVKLTARQHFVCHLLLTKMVNKQPYISKLKYAAILLYHVHGQKITSKMYESLKSNIKQDQAWITKRTKGLKGRVSPTKGTVAWNRGIPNTPEHRAKCSASLKGKATWNKGKKASKEHRKNISNGMKDCTFDHMKIKVKCKYCDKHSTQSAITRYHNDNCKIKNRS